MRCSQVRFDHSKALAFLQESSSLFESLLDAEDRGDGPAIEQVLQTLLEAEQTPVVQHLLKQLYHDKIQLRN